MSRAPDLDHELEKLESRLPSAMARLVRWLRNPAARWFRIPAAILLVLGGLVGFLPLLGFWMIPLGLALIAYDIPFLQRPVARLAGYVNRKLEARHGA